MHGQQRCFWKLVASWCWDVAISEDKGRTTNSLITFFFFIQKIILFFFIFFVQDYFKSRKMLLNLKYIGMLLGFGFFFHPVLCKSPTKIYDHLIVSTQFLNFCWQIRHTWFVRFLVMLLTMSCARFRLIVPFMARWQDILVSLLG